jgi:hypothetical protein
VTFSDVNIFKLWLEERKRWEHEGQRKKVRKMVGRKEKKEGREGGR